MILHAVFALVLAGCCLAAGAVALGRVWRDRPSIFNGPTYLAGSHFTRPLQFNAPQTQIVHSNFEFNGPGPHISGNGIALTNVLINAGGANGLVFGGGIAVGGGAGSLLAGVGLTGTEPQPEPEELALTFGTEPLVAYRVWNLEWLEHRGGELEARLAPIGIQTNAMTVWHPRQRADAFCTQHLHDAPDLDCTCGLWALRTREEAIRKGGDVIGEVALWGRTIEFEDGYRAQHAYPQRLWMGSEALARYGDELARLYGVPVEELITA